MQVALVRSDPTFAAAPKARPSDAGDGPSPPFASTRVEDPSSRPTRIGGAPLSGVLAVGAYQLTAAISGLGVLARIDEYV